MQKVVDNKLYVFDLTPFEITQDTGKEVIYVQEECLSGYKELNPSLADKMETFNQFVVCVTKPEWAQEPGPTPPTPTYYTISAFGDGWSNATLFPDTSVEAGTTVYVYLREGYSNMNMSVYASNLSTYAPIEMTYVSGDTNYYYFVMPEADVSLNVWNLYSISFTADSDAQADVDCPTLVQAGLGVTIAFLNGQSADTIDVTSTDVELIYNSGTGFYTFTMPAHAIEIKAVYKQAPAVPHTLTVTGTDLENTVSVIVDNVVQQPAASYQVAEGATVGIAPIYPPARYTLVSGASWDISTGQWIATMPNTDLTITINYALPASHEITISGYAFNGTTNSPATLYINGDTYTTSSTYTFYEGDNVFVMLRDQPQFYNITSVTGNTQNSFQSFSFIAPAQDLSLSLDWAGFSGALTQDNNIAVHPDTGYGATVGQLMWPQLNEQSGKYETDLPIFMASGTQANYSLVLADTEWSTYTATFSPDITTGTTTSFGPQFYTDTTHQLSTVTLTAPL